MSLADQVTLIRIAAVPVVVVLFVWDFDGHYWWATAVFIAAIVARELLVSGLRLAAIERGA